MPLPVQVFNFQVIINRLSGVFTRRKVSQGFTRRKAAVVLVGGAGYAQNKHERFSMLQKALRAATGAS